MGTRERKIEYLSKVEKIFTEYSKLLIVNADNVGSLHMQNIRIALRGKAIVLMGKNTLIRKALRTLIDNGNKDLEGIVPLLKGNVGLIFTKGDLAATRKTVEGLKVAAPAKVGSFAPVDVTVPKGDTGLEPTQTAFLQALNIATKINKGQIQILDDKLIISKGARVGSSEATLCQKLKILPFSYGLTVLSVYEDGSVFDPVILDISDEHILKRFSEGIQNIASLSLAVGVPTTASIPHSISNAYKNIISIAFATEFTFPRVQQLKDLLSNPAALAAAQAAAAGASSSAAPAKKEEKAPAKKEEKKKEPEPEEEEEGDMGFGLFD